ncbi:uncharacterized protein TNCV_2168201 [Trichonephila clavipes]|nr:uncharacterized protein TNCV_2168201 [Trichonephila clavipes]
MRTTPELSSPLLCQTFTYNNETTLNLCRFNMYQHGTDGLQHMYRGREWYRYRVVAGFVTSSSPVPLKTHRVGQLCTLNLSRAETSSLWCDVVVRRRIPAQVSSTSLDHGSKLRGPSPKALV